MPAGVKAMSNGRLVSRQKVDRRVRWSWSEPAPMATYLALVDIGDGKLVHGQVGKLPIWTLVDPRLVKKSKAAIDSLPEIIRFESKIYGPYPFAAAGSVVDVANLEYALETQTRPIYAFAPDRTTVVHETAHQWFGDSVSLERWPNIWLNEGFATWTQWYFAEQHGGRTAQSVFAELYRRPASQTGFWNPPSGHPGQAKNLFAVSTYVRGAMTLQALRDKIGTHDLLRIMRTWATEHRYGHGDIEEFIALAEQGLRRAPARLLPPLAVRARQALAATALSQAPRRSVPLATGEAAEGDQPDQEHDQSDPEAPDDHQDDPDDDQDAAEGNPADASTGSVSCSHFDSSVRVGRDK